MQIDLNCPIELISSELPKSEGDACVFTLCNVSDHTVISLQLLLSCENADGLEVLHQVERVHDLNVKPHETVEARVRPMSWGDVQSVNVLIEKVWYDNGDLWRKGPACLVSYQPNDLPAGRALDHLLFVAGDDAVGYPSLQKEAWVCVCGRANGHRAEQCARCGRGRLYVFATFSEEAVEAAVRSNESRMNDDGRRVRAENSQMQLNREREYAASRRKRKKRIRAAVICTVLAAALAAGYVWGLPYLKYRTAGDLLEKGEYDHAAAYYAELGDYKDSADLVPECTRRKAAERAALDTPEDLLAAKALYETLGDWHGCDTEALECGYRAAEIYTDNAAYEQAAEVYQELGDYRDSLQKKDHVFYLQAKAMMDNGSYASARVLLQTLPASDETDEALQTCAYGIGAQYLQDGNWLGALEELEPLGEYADAPELCKEARNDLAEDLRLRGDLEQAGTYYLAAGDYADAEEKGRDCNYQIALSSMQDGDFERALELFGMVGDYRDSRQSAAECTYRMALEQVEEGNIEAALTLLAALEDDNRPEAAAELEKRCYYDLAMQAVSDGDLVTAEELLEDAGDYRDSAKQLRSISYKLAEADRAEGAYERALNRYEKLDTYKNSREHAKQCRLALGDAAMEAGDYDAAIAWYDALGNYKGSRNKRDEALCAKARMLMDSGDSAAAEALLTDSTSAQAKALLTEARLAEGKALEADGRLDEAIAFYASTDGTEAKESMRRCAYQLAEQQLADGLVLEAALGFEQASGYEDAADKAQACYDQLYGTAPAQARAAAKKKNHAAVIRLLNDLPLTEESAAYGDLPDLYNTALLGYADSLYRDGKPYEAMPYYVKLGDWQQTREKKLNRRAYLVLGDWVSASGETVSFCADGTCTLGGEEMLFRVNNFSLLTGPDAEHMTVTHRLNIIDEKAMSLSDLQGTREVDYRLTRVGEWTLPDWPLTLPEEKTEPEAEAPEAEAEPESKAEVKPASDEESKADAETAADETEPESKPASDSEPTDASAPQNATPVPEDFAVEEDEPADA